MQWNKGRVKNQGIESITWIIFSTEFVLILAAEKTGSVVPLAMFFSMIALSQATRLGSGKGIAAEHIVRQSSLLSMRIEDRSWFM